MRFVSIEFLTFLAGVFLLYYQLPGKFRWIVLLIASYAFYAVFDYRCLLFILITTLSTYYAARLLGRENQRYERLLADNPHWKRLEKKAAKAQATRKKRRILLLALLLNFGILAVLKYYNFLLPMWTACYCSWAYSLYCPSFLCCYHWVFPFTPFRLPAT